MFLTARYGEKLAFEGVCVCVCDGGGGAGKRPSLMLPVSLLLHKIAITKLIIN